MANEEQLEILQSGVSAWNNYVAEQRLRFKADLSGAYLYGANLKEANLTRAKLTGANLKEANLTRANLTGANLFKAYLSGAYLYGAYLYGAYLYGAYATGANLTAADLTRANLTGAYLYGADLTEANLTGANLTGANLTRVNLNDAVWDESTDWPFEFQPPTRPTLSIPLARNLPKGNDSRRFRISVDVGSSASFEELSQILTDLGLLSEVAASWATLERELSENDESSGDVLVKAPPKTGLGGEPPSIVSVTYRNPLDIEVAGVAVGALIALVMVIPNCRKVWAEGSKAKIETEILRRQLETQPSATAEFKATPAQIVELFQAVAGSLQAAFRLSQYEIEVSEVEPDPDEDPE